MKYRIFAAFHEDTNSGWVWLATPQLPQRSVVQITNLSNLKEVYCEALQIDDNFLDLYNKDTKRIHIADQSSALVMNEWYRKRLGDFKTQTDQALSIEVVAGCWPRLYWAKAWACIRHPQVVVRLATLLGIWSVILGLIGTISGVWSVLK